MEQNKPRFRLDYVIFFNWSASRLSSFCIFLKNDKMELHQFFSGFRRKHLFIITCIEKHCTRPLRYL